ncbi:repeat-containing protein [Seminavis robusta]|uniref:Repeat-containing protein n=1 Tax=Seminavis robusta TaxID=568900 RepID=A0A9N8DN02_9STRA|nr:repeat-containing protein [Seminavis robusta]|eukprot:Sro216_g089460.1 repeat-containing protein (331) ;mRNA; r:61196-62188
MHKTCFIGFASTVVFINFILSTDAFSVTPPPLLQRLVATRGGGIHTDVSFSLHVFSNSNNHDDGGGDEDVFDVEQARKRLEGFWMTGGGGEESFSSELQQQTMERPTIRSPTYSPAPHKNPELDVVIPPAPPLTTIERERREAEIQLLGQLVEGDESVTDLWTLWFSERGSDAAQQLVRAEELTGEGPSGWQRAEEILRDLIEEHGVYWVEPVNHLATLYYMQGRVDAAETLCQIVLAVKPWHFGALSSIVMIYAAQANSEKARLWAASRLPAFAPNGANRRRIAWAEQAVLSAKESFVNAEKRVQDLFGEPDDYSVEQQTDMWDDDAWQ